MFWALGQPTTINNFELRWDKISTLELYFKQKVISKHLETEDSTEGIIYIKKPRKIRWVSKTDNTIMILNRNKATIIRTSKRGKVTVEIYENATSKIDTRFLDFLSGKTKISEVYSTKIMSENDESAEIELKKDKETIFVKISKKDFIPVSISTETNESKTYLEFFNTKINTVLNDSLFAYTPKPTDIIYKK